MNSVAQLKKLLSDSKEELLRSLDQSEKAIISLIQKNAEPEELPVKRSATKSRLRKLTRGGESIQKKPKREEAPRHEPIPKKAKHDETSEESASSDEESENLFDTESEPEVQSKPAVKEVKEPEPEEVNYSRKPRTTETVNALVQELKGAPESRAKILLDQLNLLISTNFDKNCLNLLASTKLVPTLTALGKERPGLKDKVDYMRTNWRNRSASLTGGVENWGRLTTRLADASQSNNYNEVKNCLAKVQTSFPDAVTPNIADGFKKCMAEVRKISELSKNAELKERAKKLYGRYRAKFDQLKF